MDRWLSRHLTASCLVAASRAAAKPLSEWRDTWERCGYRGAVKFDPRSRCSSPRGAGPNARTVGGTSSIDRVGGSGAVSVPAACPVEAVNAGNYGHSQTGSLPDSPITSPPADGQATADPSMIFQAVVCHQTPHLRACRVGGVPGAFQHDDPQFPAAGLGVAQRLVAGAHACGVRPHDDDARWSWHATPSWSWPGSGTLPS